MNKTKVLHITFDMRIGGTEMVIKNIIEGSDPEIFDMSIFCVEEPMGPWGMDLQNNGIKISAKARHPGFDVSLVFSIRKHIKVNKIDVIHCHQYTPWVYGVLAAFGTKVRVVFTEHGRFYPDSSSWKRKLINPWLCLISDHITVISKATKQALVEFENIPENKIKVIYNGIKKLEIIEDKVTALKHRLGLSKNTKVLGTIARLDPIKNHIMMLNAFFLILKVHPDTVLILVGDGEERPNIEKKIHQLGIKDKVLLTGYDPQPQHYLAIMDIFLLSSLSEGTSMTLLEAMSLGKPCVVTDAGGNPEIIRHEYNGMVTANNNANEFFKAINHLLNDVKSQREMSSNALERFNTMFASHIMTDLYQASYKQPSGNL